MAGCTEANSKTKTNTRLSFQHKAQARRAENTGLREDVWVSENPGGKRL